MRYRNTCIEAFGYTLPEEIVTSEELESRLSSLYRRLQLAPGMLKAMYGISERRFWPRETLPSSMSIQSVEALIQNAGIGKEQIGALVHGSVCRDYAEPATACIVHEALQLPQACLMYDVSNACLGMLTGIVHVANMIELNQISAAIVVGTESSRRLIESTIDVLNSDASLSRSQITQALASLTIGSASVAVLIVNKALSRTGNRLLAAVARGDSAGWRLCRSRLDASIAGDERCLIETNSGPLVEMGIALTSASIAPLLDDAEWTHRDLDRTICHQVGSRPRKLMLESLAIDPAIDLTTYETLGNTGAAAIPLTMAIAVKQGKVQDGHRVALLGSGSGVNSLLLALDWRRGLIG